ncbi:uncharacterized protein LOC110723981 [Chenopodium quinoa]|uniref:uncharacterized protein LOC110723981 n=1 Tax=Chenopodium quinoa TaxID=63459 RepID=UPI000B78A9F9|nr:uncharacterized protein LOC110723981 [Chenopodium quinoa]
MNKIQITSVFVLLLLSHPITLSKAFDVSEGNGVNSIVTSLLISSWDKVKYLLQEVQNKYLPPNLDFRIQEKDGADEFESHDSSKRIRTAAKKSFKEGEATLEKTAESAATVMDHAMHKAKDKVENKFSHHRHGREADDEL